MKVTAQKLPESQILLEIEIDPADMEKSMDKAYRKLVQKVDVPGFRKGKTPRNMLERHIGRGRLLEEAIDIVIPEAYNKALEDEDIDAIDQPKIEIVTPEPLAFKATVPIRPNIDLGDYASVRVPREPVEVDEQDVEASLQELRQRYAIQEPVDRPVQSGDVITADISIEVDGKDVFKDDDAELHLREGRTVLLPGFSEGVVGAVKGEPKDIEVTLPEDAESSLAGKTAMVHVTVKEVKEERLPEPDDDFATQVGEGFESLAALKDRLTGDIRERLEAQDEEKYRDEVLTALLDSVPTLEYPPVLVEREVDRFLNEQARSTGMELDRYLELLKQTKEQVRDDLRPSATERVKRSLILGRLADAENIEVPESDIDAEVERLVMGAGGGNDEKIAQYRQIFRSAEARASLSRSLQTRKTFERLVEIASQDGDAAPKKKKKSSSKKATAEVDAETETPETETITEETETDESPEVEMAKEEA
ncbi:MAG: trigger factor [Chloroflexota bacterium]